MQSFLMPGIVCDVSMYLCMGDAAIAACEAIEITEPGFSLPWRLSRGPFLPTETLRSAGDLSLRTCFGLDLWPHCSCEGLGGLCVARVSLGAFSEFPGIQRPSAPPGTPACSRRSDGRERSLCHPPAGYLPQVVSSRPPHHEVLCC